MNQESKIQSLTRDPISRVVGQANRRGEIGQDSGEDRIPGVTKRFEAPKTIKIVDLDFARSRGRQR